jgi:uncharacterized protein YheU (UPF0270 family)
MGPMFFCAGTESVRHAGARSDGWTSEPGGDAEDVAPLPPMPPPEPDGVEIPWRELSEQALRGAAESFVGREGTDYGAVERSFDAKVEAVLGQLRRGEATILFDPETESLNIVVVA